MQNTRSTRYLKHFDFTWPNVKIQSLLRLAVTYQTHFHLDIMCMQYYPVQWCVARRATKNWHQDSAAVADTGVLLMAIKMRRWGVLPCLVDMMFADDKVWCPEDTASEEAEYWLGTTGRWYCSCSTPSSRSQQHSAWAWHHQLHSSCRMMLVLQWVFFAQKQQGTRSRPTNKVLFNKWYHYHLFFSIVSAPCSCSCITMAIVLITYYTISIQHKECWASTTAGAPHHHHQSSLQDDADTTSTLFSSLFFAHQEQQATTWKDPTITMLNVAAATSDAGSWIDYHTTAVVWGVNVLVQLVGYGSTGMYYPPPLHLHLSLPPHDEEEWTSTSTGAPHQQHSQS